MARYFMTEFDMHDILLNFYRNFILNFCIQYSFSKQFVNHIWSSIELNASEYILSRENDWQNPTVSDDENCKGPTDFCREMKKRD